MKSRAMSGREHQGNRIIAVVKGWGHGNEITDLRQGESRIALS
jgi:hypothetical protein